MTQPDFTNIAMAALRYAREWSQKTKSVYVGTEHILLGLVETKDARLFSLLSGLGVDADELADATRKLIAGGEIEVSHDDFKRFRQMAEMRNRVIDTSASSTAPLPDVAYSPAARKALVDTGEVALSVNAPMIDGVHLLAALTKEPTNIAAQVLKEREIDFYKLARLLGT